MEVNGAPQTFKVLTTIAFNSTRKRMSVIVKCVLRTVMCILYVLGYFMWIATRVCVCMCVTIIPIQSYQSFTPSLPHLPNPIQPLNHSNPPPNQGRPRENTCS